MAPGRSNQVVNRWTGIRVWWKGQKHNPAVAIGHEVGAELMNVF